MLKKLLYFLYFKNFKILFSSYILYSTQYIKIKKYINFLFSTILNILSLKTNDNTIFIFFNIFIEKNILITLLKLHFFIRDTILFRKLNTYIYIDAYFSYITNKKKNLLKTMIQKYTHFMKLKYNFRFTNLEKHLNNLKKSQPQFFIYIRQFESKLLNKHLYLKSMQYFTKLPSTNKILYLFF